MDTARSLAADMVKEVGWADALDTAIDVVWTAPTWARVWRGVQLLIAVTFA